MQYSDGGVLFGDGVITFKTCEIFTWMLDTAEGWCPLEQVNNETLHFLKSHIENKLAVYPALVWSFMNRLLENPHRERNINGFMPLLMK